MVRYLVVVTIALFFLALLQCCFAGGGGGSPASEDPASAYISVLILNRVLYDITIQDNTNPSEKSIREWIKRLNEFLKLRLCYTKRLAGILVNRSNFVRRKVKSMGGRARNNFLSRSWTLSISEKEIDPSVQQENSMLQEKVKSLEDQVLASSRLLQSIQQNTPAPKRSAKHYSKRHERGVKKQRVSECSASLAWLQQEGLTPVEVVVVNSETKEVQHITLRKDLEQALNLSGEQMSDEDADMISMMLYVKDKYNISGSAYHEMASLCKQMPRHYKLKQRGDWKFLAMITGIDSASSKYACIWCKCPALNRYDTTQKWSIDDVTLGARTIEENKRIAQSRSKRFNVTNEPIFQNIPLTRVIVDNLHMFLRVADVLVDLLLLELKRLDRIKKATSVKSIEQLQYISKYESTLKNLGISGFNFWILQDSIGKISNFIDNPEVPIIP